MKTHQCYKLRPGKSECSDREFGVRGSVQAFPLTYPTGCLLGSVNVVDCLPQEEYQRKFPLGESQSPFVFICNSPQELPIRFPISGKHKICKLCNQRLGWGTISF
ncbi:Activating signal cointegrator 1 [Homalodisca vitripennis]|nr:Activating signal cointegrator 1 [Homalodisca vitripennis]